MTQVVANFCANLILMGFLLWLMKNVSVKKFPEWVRRSNKFLDKLPRFSVIPVWFIRMRSDRLLQVWDLRGFWPKEPNMYWDGRARIMCIIVPIILIWRFCFVISNCQTILVCVFQIRIGANIRYSQINISVGLQVCRKKNRLSIFLWSFLLWA